MIHISALLKHYKRDDVQRAILDAADNKEIAVKYGDSGFGKRPDVLKYPRDILEFAKKGATSFHCSEELWYNPLGVVTGMKPHELDALRKGWDLVLDIDCPELEYSKIAAHLLVEALKHYDVRCSVKFSGNHGFHIAVPFEAFPDFVADKSVKDLFPEGPKRIAIFLQEKIRHHLAKSLASRSLDEIADKVGKQPSDLVKNGVFDPFEVLAIDTILISSRHLYRMPWSFNEKSGLVSVVIRPRDVLSFDKESALPHRVSLGLPFLRRDVAANEARRLFVEAFDFKPSIEGEPQVLAYKEFEPVEDAVPEEFFPPCIRRIAQGLEDGKKRAVLVLINFLSSVGWSHNMIEEYLEKWNRRNPDPLRDVYVKGQLRYHKAQKKNAPPPNCDNKAYMKDMRVCLPDEFCARIKNPASYAVKRLKIHKLSTKNRGRMDSE